MSAGKLYRLLQNAAGWRGVVSKISVSILSPIGERMEAAMGACQRSEYHVLCFAWSMTSKVHVICCSDDRPRCYENSSTARVRLSMQSRKQPLSKPQTLRDVRLSFYRSAGTQFKLSIVVRLLLIVTSKRG